MSASLGSTVKDFHESERRERTPWLRIDPFLFIGAIGLIVCSVYVVGNATRHDIPGNPDYYLVRQAAYGIVGILFMVVLARVDYSRMREWRWGIYATMIGLILLVLAIGSAARGSQRWIPLPFFNLQPSELGKVLLVVALAGFGAGQKTGRGPHGATQTQLNFIPEHHTDFIFSVVGEEFGFAGCAVVLALYALLLWRALRVLTLAKNVFGALVAGGIAAMLAFQIFVNVGMTIGIMPITGVPLPLMSYAGSPVIGTFLATGLLQSIHVQGPLAQANTPRDLNTRPGRRR